MHVMLQNGLYKLLALKRKNFVKYYKSNFKSHVINSYLFIFHP